MKVRRNVIFQSAAFNTSQVKDYFINDCCFGDDLANWLMEQLRARGVETAAEPGQEDFGWYFRFRAGESDCDFLITWRPGEGDQPGDWICTIERGAGFLASIFGARKREIPPEAARAIHTVLSSSPQIAKIRWYDDEELRFEETGHETPLEE
jgi:hypothetical protein